MANPRFQRMRLDEKMKVAEGYFKDNIEVSPRYALMDDSVRGRIKKDFMSTIGYDYKPELPDGARAVSDGMQVTTKEKPMFQQPGSNRGRAMIADLNEMVKAVKSGFQKSLIGLASRGELPEGYLPKNTFHSLVESATNIVADLPFYAGFARLGAVSGGGMPTAVTGGGAAFGGVEGIRKVLMDSYEKGDIKSIGDFGNRLLDAVKESAKSYAVGGGLGTVSRFTSQFGKGMTGKLAGYGTETGYLTLAGSIVEGEMPTVDSLIHNATLVAGFKAAGVLKRNKAKKAVELFEAYKKAGIDRVTKQEAERVIKLIEEPSKPKEKPAAPEPEIPYDVRPEAPKREISVEEAAFERAEQATAEVLRGTPGSKAETTIEIGGKKETIRAGAEKRTGKPQEAQTPEPATTTTQPEGEVVKPERKAEAQAMPEKPPEPAKNPYLTMPIDRVRADAKHGVKLAKDALKAREKPPEPAKPAEKPAEAKGKEAWEMTLPEIESRYPVFKNVVDGRKVRDKIPNLSSIESSIDNPTELKGIREVSMSEFDAPAVVNQKTKELARQIKESGEINPLIVVIDSKGAYILEGANRYDALKILGAKSFPAKVVIDEGALFESTKQALSEGKPIPPEVQAEYPDLFPEAKGAEAKMTQQKYSSKVHAESFRRVNQAIKTIIEESEKNAKRESRQRRKWIDNAFGTLRVHLPKLAMEMEKRGTYYTPEHDIKIVKALQEKYPDVFESKGAEPKQGGEELRYSVGGQFSEFMKGKKSEETGKETKLSEGVAKATYNLITNMNNKLTGKKLPEYARSINLRVQKNVPEAAKQFELEIGKLRPKKVQTWEETAAKSKSILEDIDKSAKIMRKVEKGQALNTEEIDALGQIYIGGLNRFIEIARDPEMTPEKYKEELSKFENDIFTIRSDAGSEAGRTLNILKRTLAYKQVGTAIKKLGDNLTPEQFERIKNTNYENPLEVQRLEQYLKKPKLMDYVYEYWYNSILSGIPTHIVNIAGNTSWQAFQLPHKAIKAIVDKGISTFSGRPRQYYLNEIIPMAMGYKGGFRKGARKAWQVFKTGEIQDIESKWQIEMRSVIGAFERSPNRVMRAIAPFISAPTRALRAMDVWAFNMAYDAELNAIARRYSNNKGLTGEKRSEYERKLLENPSETMMKEATEFGRYSTFNNDPGKVANWIMNGRDIVPAGRFVVPFIRTVANLFKRGVEMTPGLGLALANQNKIPDMIAKQIEGAIITIVLGAAINAGHIKMTGRAPQDKNEREAFYREGKRPWAIKIGSHWIEYRRIEPLNTPLAMIANFLNAAKRYKETDDALSDIFADTAAGIVENLIDSPYLQGVTNLLDRYGRREGMLKRTAVSFVPYSGFWRSINRAYEAATEGKATVKEGKDFMVELGQVIPGLSKDIPARLNVWGEEIEFEGGMLRQWLPWKWAKKTDDPLEKELEHLDIYPGLPGKNVTINKHPVTFEGEFYREYAIHFGNRAHTIFSNVIKDPRYKRLSDEAKFKALNTFMRKIRDEELTKAKIEYVKRWKKNKATKEQK